MTYTPILNAEVDAESPVTDLLLTRLRDNPLAIAAGDAGAPRIDIGALTRLTAGDVIRARQDPLLSGPLGGTLLIVIMTASQVGTVRITYEHRSTGGPVSGSAFLSRSRGTSYTILANNDNSGSFVTRTIDVPVLPGDTVRLGINEFGASIIPQLQNIRVQTGGENLYSITQGFALTLENVYA
jgi:hypothetical protein